MRTKDPAYALHPMVSRAVSELCDGIPSSCIGIHGNLYDVTDFVDRHPGGAAWIGLCRGMDATALFESMHLNQSRALALLATLPTRGTHEQRIAWEYGAYRTIADRAARQRFAQRSARRETADSSRRFRTYACAVGLLHALLLRAPASGILWWSLCVLSGVANTILGGYGHNYLHQMDPRALALDWNGLSSFEWCLEHVASHHPHPNTPQDHDSISMSPFVSWLRPTWSNVLIYPLFCVGEVAVALQGNLGHRCRWHAMGRRDVPRWMRWAPWLFVSRVATHLLAHGWAWGLVGVLATTGIASFYFALMAHLNHAPQADSTKDFLTHQLGSTHDLRVAPRVRDAALGLDRQTLHHLFPSVDHSRLDDNLRRAVQAAGAPLVRPRTVLELWRDMHVRLFTARRKK